MSLLAVSILIIIDKQELECKESLARIHHSQKSIFKLDLFSYFKCVKNLNHSLFFFGLGKCSKEPQARLEINKTKIL